MKLEIFPKYNINDCHIIFIRIYIIISIDINKFVKNTSGLKLSFTRTLISNDLQRTTEKIRNFTLFFPTQKQTARGGSSPRLTICAQADGSDEI